MLMLEEALARVRTTLDVETMQLTIAQDNRQLLVADLNDEGERAKVEQFFWQLVPSFRSPPTLVRSPDGHFMDKPDNVISLINLATMRSLEQQWGIRIDPLRFRANFYIDGAETLGRVRMDRQRHPDRRRAVSRRPAQWPMRRDQRRSARPAAAISICRARLRAAFGHKEFGIYLIARESVPARGRRSCRHARQRRHDGPRAGSAFRRSRKPNSRNSSAAAAISSTSRLSGLPDQSIARARRSPTIPSNWRCPDCGTEKTTFRPYVEPDHHHTGGKRQIV